MKYHHPDYALYFNGLQIGPIVDYFVHCTPIIMGLNNPYISMGYR